MFSGFQLCLKKKSVLQIQMIRTLLMNDKHVNFILLRPAYFFKNLVSFMMYNIFKREFHF